MRTTISSLLLLVFFAPGYADDLELNKQLVVRMTDAIDRRDFDALDELVAADIRRHCAATPGVEVTNLDQFKAFLRQDLAAVPDARQEITHMVAEGDRVATRAIYRGTQTGAMGPFPPSGKNVEIPFLGILRIENRKIAEIWVEWDNLSALVQLGHFNPPAAAASSDEAKKALARRWFEQVINARDVDAVDAIYAPGYRYHAAKGLEMSGLEPVRRFASAILAASDDRRAVVDQQLVEGDLVVTRFTSRGTNTGPWQGREPTGKPWTTEGIVISRIENGKIAEEWEVTVHSGM